MTKRLDELKTLFTGDEQLRHVFFSQFSEIFFNYQPLSSEKMSQFFQELHTGVGALSFSLRNQSESESSQHYIWQLTGFHEGALFGYSPTKHKLLITGDACFLQHEKGESFFFSFDKQSALEQILRFSDKRYSLSDFNTEGLSQETMVLFQSVLNTEEPPCNINQLLANQFRQALQKNGPDLDPKLNAHVEKLNQQVAVQTLHIPLEGRTIRALYYRPVTLGKHTSHSLFLYLHGGGWVMGSPEFYDLHSRDLCLSTGWPLLCIDYRLAPEHSFGELFDDCYQSYCWLQTSEAASLLKQDIKRIALGGDSCGGALSAGLVNKMIDEACPLPDKLLLLSPVTDMEFENHRFYNERAFNDLFIPAALAACQRSIYLPHDYWTDPRFSPIHGELKYYPDTLISTGAQDPFAGDNHAFVEKLQRASKAKVVHYIAQGFSHDFQLFLPLSKQARDFFKALDRFLKA